MVRACCLCRRLTNGAINQNAIQFVDNQRMSVTHHTSLLTELAIISPLVSSQSKRASCSRYHGTFQSATVFLIPHVPGRNYLACQLYKTAHRLFKRLQFWLREPDRRVLSLIKHGHYRHLERLYAIKRYLNRQSFNYGKAERALGEALEGPIAY